MHHMLLFFSPETNISSMIRNSLAILDRLLFQNQSTTILYLTTGPSWISMMISFNCCHCFFLLCLHNLQLQSVLIIMHVFNTYTIFHLVTDQQHKQKNPNIATSSLAPPIMATSKLYIQRILIGKLFSSYNKFSSVWSKLLVYY